jgi:hypothetical protein
MKESRYLVEVRRLPRPSNAQVDAFVEYVTVAHSWYKHLPAAPPGKLFLFFLNPNAGRERGARRSGSSYRDRTTDTPRDERFHYTWRPTAEYVQLFGHLDYFASAGTSFLVPTMRGVLDTRAVPEIQASDGAWLELPEEIRTLGAVHLTSAIHPLAWAHWWMKHRRSETLGDSSDQGRDPSDRVFFAIHREMSRRLRILADGESPESEPDAALQEFTPPGVTEQTDRMRQVVGRVLEWVYGRS